MDHQIDRTDLELIPAVQLSKCVGKVVLYRWHKDMYVPVVLGKRVAETHYYYGCYVYQQQEPQSDILCCADDLYRRLRKGNK